MTAIAPSQPGQCCLCRLTEEGVGYHPFGGRKLFTSDQVAWTCEHDLQLAKGWWHLAAAIRTRIEEQALSEAARLSGDYFDRLGKTDIGQFSRAEYETLYAVFLEHFGNEMRRLTGAETAPF